MSAGAPTRSTPAAGGAMKLIQLTDIHLTAPGELVAGRDPRANLEAALAEIETLHADAELVVLTGDLCEHASEEAYGWLRDRLARLSLPTALMIGNHDDRALFLSVFPEHVDRDGHVQTVHRLSRGTALCLDTVEPGENRGRLGPERLAWLEARLDECEGPAWIFLHHNPIPTHIASLDRIMLTDHAEFARLVAARRERVAHIFHGHCHLPMAGSLAGVPVTSGRGTNQAGYPYFGFDELFALSDLPEAYSVIIADGAAVTVMMVEFGYQRRRALAEAGQ